MEIDSYQKQLILDLLLVKAKDLQKNINKLNQTVKHDETWAIPMAKRSNSEEIIKNIEDIVTWAKRDIKANEKDLEEVNILIEKIKNLDGN